MKDAAFFQFIREHLNDDLHRLLLSASRYPDIPVAAAVAQIEAIRKMRDKAPSWANAEGLLFPPALSVEQGSSELTATYKSRLFSGKKMADLTGGMGIDSYFFSKNFEEVHYVEQQEHLAETAQYNFDRLKAHNIIVHKGEALAFLNQSDEEYDLIYLDPARRDEQKNKVFRLSDVTPDVTQMQARLLERSPNILIKMAPMLDISDALRQLQKVAGVWVVSVKNECKEVLYWLHRDAAGLSPDEIPVTAVSPGENEYALTFTKKEEAQAAATCCHTPLRYLYEPDAAVMKAGAFHYFAAKYQLYKLHPHTHLYTSEASVNVPGRAFEVIAVVRYDAAEVAKYLPDQKANIAVRNFPDSAEMVKKRLKLKDGGNFYLFAATSAEQKRIIIICKKSV